MLIASNNGYVRNKLDLVENNESSELISSEFNSGNVIVCDFSGIDAQTPNREENLLLSPSAWISPIAVLYDGNWVSPASNVNSYYDSFSETRFDKMGCEAQALGSYNVQIQDSIEANSETMLNSSIENAETLSGSLLHSESIKWCYKKEEEKDKEFYKHVNNTYKQIEKYSNKYL